MVKESNVYKLLKGISFEEAAMLEPCAVAVHSLNLAGELNGKTVMITGSGTISSILVQVALSKGAKNVVLLARNNEKMDFIKSTCSNIYIVNSDEGDLCGVISKLVGALPDIVIEGTGASEMLSNSINIIKRKGVLLMADMLDYLAWRGDIEFPQMPVNPVDALIFSTLSYIQFEDIVPDNPTQSISMAEAAAGLFSLAEPANRTRVKKDLELLKAAAESPQMRI